LHGEPFNFGPTEDDGQKTVGELINKLTPYLGAGKKLQTSRSPNTFLESNLLQLNCEKSKNLLQWKSVLNFDETARFTAEWYKNWSDRGDAKGFTVNQIDKYTDLATRRNLEWTK
jgi:CDP-glucose 4,6-dehydratase